MSTMFLRCPGFPDDVEDAPEHPVEAQVYGEFAWYYEESEPSCEWRRIRILGCPRCGTVMVVFQYAPGETLDTKPRDEEWEKPIFLFATVSEADYAPFAFYNPGPREYWSHPLVWEDYLEVKPVPNREADDEEVPSKVAGCLGKAKRYLEKGDYEPCVMECRKTLEQMCRECGVQVQGLGRALRELNEGGIIDRKMLDWAIKTKVLGGEVVHAAGREVDKETATLALKLVEVMVRYVFVIPKQYERFLKCLREEEGDDKSE